MASRGNSCPDCGQLFNDIPLKCPHCGHQFRKTVDNGRLSDLVPGFRRLPYVVRKAIIVIAVFCVVAYIVDLPDQFHKLHVFMSRRGLPHWMTR
jgi:hypothetical protein